jgi:hypothetical protein
MEDPVSNCTQHLSYLEAVAKGLEQAVARKLVPKAKEARSELLQSLTISRTSWSNGLRGAS